MNLGPNPTVANPAPTAEEAANILAAIGAEAAQTAATENEMTEGTEEEIRSMSPLRVAQAISALSAAGVTSVAGRTGDVTLASADIVDASSLGSESTAGKAALYGAEGELGAAYLHVDVGPVETANYFYDKITANISGDFVEMNFPTTGNGTLMLGSNNLSDLTSASTARTNLGLGMMDSVIFWSITQGAGSTFNSGAVNVYLLAPNVWRNALELDESDNPRFANLTVSGTVKTTATVFASLPAASTAGAGARSFITDCNTATFLATAAGGGANAVPVVSDGTNWLVG